MPFFNFAVFSILPAKLSNNLQRLDIHGTVRRVMAFATFLRSLRNLRRKNTQTRNKWENLIKSRKTRTEPVTFMIKVTR